MKFTGPEYAIPTLAIGVAIVMLAVLLIAVGPAVILPAGAAVLLTRHRTRRRREAEARAVADHRNTWGI